MPKMSSGQSKTIRSWSEALPSKRESFGRARASQTVTGCKLERAANLVLLFSIGKLLNYV